jgi:hypothetical protein
MNVKTAALSVGLCAALVTVFAWNRATPVAWQPKDPERIAKHAKLYKEYAHGKKLGDEMDAMRIMVRSVSRNPKAGGLPEFLREHYCAADAVIEGTVQDSEAALTEERTFVFSDYTVRVSRIFKNITSQTIRDTDELVVTRAGGEVPHSGRNKKLRASDDAYPPLEIGSTYVLFLKYFSEPDTFKTTDPDGTYGLSRSRVTYLGATAPPELSGVGPEQFVATLGGITVDTCTGGR